MHGATSIALAMALVLVATHANAEPTAAERETARTLLLSGKAKRKAGHLREALADMERAHAIMHVPTTGLELGRTQSLLGMLVEARATLLEAAHHPARDGEPAAFKRARKEAKRFAEELAPRLATLTITVVAPGDTRPVVKVDDAEISSSSIGTPLKVNPGHRVVTATLGGVERRAEIDLAERSSQSVELSFTDVAREGTSSPSPSPSAASGAPSRATTDATTPPKTSTNPLVWVGLATAGAGLATGAVTGVLAFSTKSDVEGRCDPAGRCPPETHSDIDRGETFATISTIAFVVAAVGAGVAVYGWLTPTTRTASTSPTSVMVTPLGIIGAF